MSQVVDCMCALRRVLEGYVCNPSQSLSLEDASTIGITANVFICLHLRYLFGSPQMVHLRGGCCHVLQCLERLEEVMGLHPLSLSVAAERAPAALGRPDLSTVALNSGVETVDDAPTNYKGGHEEIKPPTHPPQINSYSISIRSSRGLSRRLNRNSILSSGLGSVTADMERSERLVRKALASSAGISTVANCLQDLEALLSSIVFALGQDCLTNLPDVADCALNGDIAMMDSLKSNQVVLGNNCNTNLDDFKIMK